MTEQLRTGDWRQLADIWRSIGEAPAGDAELGLERGAALLGDMLGGVNTLVTIAARSERRRRARDPLDGFRPSVHIDARREPWRADLAAEWSSVASNYIGDPTMRRLADGAGRQRAIRLGASAGPRWRDTPLGRLLAVLQLRDRLIGAVPLTSDVELILVVDRDRGDRAFGARDEARLRCGLDGFRTTARRVARTHGLMDSERRLARRESEVLRCLLRGATESQVADELGISAGTVHQYAVRLHRAFGVHSRAELLALFLRDASPSR